jgi:antitoxin YefM
LIVDRRTGILYALARGQFVIETTYTNLRQSLASVLDRVANDHEVVIVRRKGDKTVAMVRADELAGLLETAHLLRSPRNARRLLTALKRATAGKGKPERVDKLRREMGFAAQR